MDMYLHLLSGASSDIFTNNQPNCFTNQLPEPIHLPPNTYVGLAQISYVNTIYNISKLTDSLTIYDMFHEYVPGSEENPGSKSLFGKFYLPKIEEGIYNDPKDLCKMLNEAIQTCGVDQLKDKNVFSYDERSRKFSYDVDNFYGSVWMHGQLLYLLGAEETRENKEYGIIGWSKQGKSYDYGGVERLYFNPDQQWKATSDEKKDRFQFVSQLQPIDFMQVYTDISSPIVTGDTYSNLLRSIAINSSEVGNRKVQSFQKIIYIPVSKRYITSVTVHLKTIFDEFVPFAQGITQLTLHFKQKNANI